MSVKILKKELNNNYFSFNSFCFLADKTASETYQPGIWAIFTHGYTASKSDCLSWAQRLSEAGINVCIFDLPGHHLGSLHSVSSFEDFRDYSHECFVDAFNYLKSSLKGEECSRLILGGHSLGALLALKALEITAFSELSPISIGIGLGIGQHQETHLFESAFYQKTLNIRRQLVDDKIDSDLIFPWIKEEKLNLSMTQKRIHLICGLDDVVVGNGGMEALAFNLEALGNHVTKLEPKKLPHHEPSSASSYIMSFIRSELSL